MRRWNFLILTCACMAVLTALMVGSALAAQKKSKGQAPSVVSAKPSKPLPEQSQQSTKKPGARTITERRSDAIQGATTQVSSEPKPTTLKAHRPLKVHKKVVAKAVVQPRTDLMYHGMLEDRRRYDPRLNTRTDGVPSPQTPELVYDHFQELDRNQDGKIDPAERALGRLDIDRDLHSRQPQ
ncbi:MAG: EF-hand domain-containing protein [Nitrospira sp.]